MGVAVRANEGDDFDAVAADFAREIGEDQKGRDDRQFSGSWGFRLRKCGKKQPSKLP